MPLIIERIDLLKAARNVAHTSHLLIVAPAGYGKSLLLQQLEQRLPASRVLQLTVEDQDAAVLQARFEEAPATVYLLDDVHHLRHAPAAVTYLLTQMRQRRCILAGRSLPFDLLQLQTLPFVQWDERELVFSLEQTRLLLERADADGWQAELSGWPLGIGLVRQLPASQARPPQVRRQLFDYLASTVLDAISDELRDFLLTTAIPLSFSAELAADLLDIDVDEAADRQQQLLARNLFLAPTDTEGWFRYHDLFRRFLIESAGDQVAKTLISCARWHVANDQPQMAIEHFLLAGAQQQALKQMTRHVDSLMTNQGRYLTYRRWLKQIDVALLVDHIPFVLVYLNNIQYEARYRAEAARLLQQLNVMPSLDDRDRRLLTMQQANLHHINHQYDLAIRLLQPLVLDAELPQDRMPTACQIVAVCYAEQLQFVAAHAFFRRAIEAATHNEQPGRVRNAEMNLAATTLAPLGRYGEALAIAERAIAAEDADYWRMRYLLSGCAIAFRCGARDRLGSYLAQIEQIVQTLEHVVTSDRCWIAHYQALLRALVGKERDPAIDEIWDDESESSRIWNELLQLTTWRMIGDKQHVDATIQSARHIAQQLSDHAYERAYLALEADIAAGLAYVRGDCDDFQISPMTRRLVNARCRGDALRLLALLTLVCHKKGSRRWQRYCRRALALLSKPTYDLLLTARDRPLGLAFWKLLLVESVAEQKAKAALVTIGSAAAVWPLLGEQRAQVRRQAAAILAQIGDERAMVPLNALQESDEPTRAAVAQALQRLEQLPPPPLTIKLLGSFALWRGSEPIDADAFYRPIVLRLFQYFATRRGRPVPRDQILDDLWPDSEPQKAWRSFKSVYSRLRATLEPYMRSGGPNRYFALEGDTYRFDPHGIVTVDADQFVDRVQQSLQMESTYTLPHGFEVLLANYQPLLADLPYTDWLLDLREQVDGAYVEGCLHVATIYLARNEPPKAQQWAERALAHSDWLETAHQIRIRALARQGRRAQALQAYAKAAEVLERAFGVQPSPLTEWLNSRVRAGEPI